VARGGRRHERVEGRVREFEFAGFAVSIALLSERGIDR
jgi:hypothetical protein